jgi:Trk K+ transport system NAD-binding subunit
MTFRQYALLPEGKDSALIGLKIAELSFPDEVEVVSVHREGILIQLHDELCLEADDQVTLLGPSDTMPSLGEPLPIQEPLE